MCRPFLLNQWLQLLQWNFFHSVWDIAVVAGNEDVWVRLGVTFYHLHCNYLHTSQYEKHLLVLLLKPVASMTTESRTHTVVQGRVGKPWPEQGDKDLQTCSWPHPAFLWNLEPCSFACLDCLLWREERQRQSDWGEYEVETGPDRSQTRGVKFLNHKCIWMRLI